MLLNLRSSSKTAFSHEFVCIGLSHCLNYHSTEELLTVQTDFKNTFPLKYSLNMSLYVFSIGPAIMYVVFAGSYIKEQHEKGVQRGISEAP